MNEKINMMMEKAKDALSHSYSPYSNFPVGVCIETDTGNFYTGCNVENRSFSQSQCAEASAIGNMVTSGDKHIDCIVVVAIPKIATTPCGGCRTKLNEFANPDSAIHLCNKDGYIKTILLHELYPSPFKAHF